MGYQIITMVQQINFGLSLVVAHVCGKPAWPVNVAHVSRDFPQRDELRGL